MFWNKYNIKIKIIRNNEGLYSNDEASANISKGSNKKLIDKLIKKEFKSLSDRIHHEINDNELIIKSDIICRDYLKLAVKRIVKGYNNKVGRQ